MFFTICKIVGCIGGIIFGGISIVGEIGDAKELIEESKKEKKTKK